MKMMRFGVLLTLIPLAAQAAVTVEYSALFQDSTQIASYTTENECLTAAQARASTTTAAIRCRTSTMITGSGGSTAKGSIQLSAATYSVNEGAGSVTITLKRVNGSSGAVGVTFGTKGVTATWGSDYTPIQAQTVSWAAGDATDKTIRVTVLNDTASESTETFSAVLSAPTGGATLGSPATATVSILDNDSGSTPEPDPTTPTPTPTTPTSALGYYTDLSSAPAGAKVTAYGSGFGTSGTVTLGGSTQQVVSYSNTKVVFTVSGGGGALTIGGRSVGTLPVHTGRVREANTSTLKAVWDTVQPGDVIYLRAGTYTGNYGEATWTADAQLDTFKQGTATQPIALVAYPGESVTFKSGADHGNFVFADGRGAKARFITIAGLNIIGRAETVTAGGDTSNGAGGPDETGGDNIRVVANRLEITDATNNTMTGIMSIQGDKWKVLGNTFVDPSNRVIINNNHALYIQNGADDVEVAYNRFVGLHMGHVIQVHQDGTPKLYERILIHDNLLQGTRNTDMRGINVGNVSDSSTFTIERNTLRNLGQNFSGIALYHGTSTVKGNLFYSVLAPDIDLNGQGGGTRKVTATDNHFETTGGYAAVETENGASLSEITLSGNQYCGVSTLAKDSSPQTCTN